MSGKRIFVSDIHLADDARYSDPVPERRARFLPYEHGERLLNFLDKQVLAEKNDVKDLVLLGDVFDTWVCPFDAVPQTYTSIFESMGNKQILDSLRRVANTNINLYYVNGNHDHDLTEAQIQEAIPGIITNPICYEDNDLGLYAEHGHRFTLFNRGYKEVCNGMPIGYFITRLAEHIGGYVRGFKDLIGYIDEAIDLVAGVNNIFEAIIEGLAKRVDAEQIILSEQETISVDQVKSLYKNLEYHDKPFKVGMMLANENDLENFGDRLCEQHGYNIVVFGHTHVGKIDKDSLFVRDRVYINSGDWCGKVAHCAVVEPGDKGETVASLLAIDAAGEIVAEDSDSKKIQISQNRIFISYAREDLDKVRTIAGALEAKGWLVWWGQKIPPGRMFSEVIEKELDNAQIVLVVWSRTSVKSNWVLEESEEGRRKGKKLIPVFTAVRVII